MRALLLIALLLPSNPSAEFYTHGYYTSFETDLLDISSIWNQFVKNSQINFVSPVFAHRLGTAFSHSVHAPVTFARFEADAQRRSRRMPAASALFSAKNGRRKRECFRLRRPCGEPILLNCMQFRHSFAVSSSLAHFAQENE